MRGKLLQRYGLDRLGEHLPELFSWRVSFFLLEAAIWFCATSGAMIVVDRLWPRWTAIGQLAAYAVGFWFTAGFFWRKEAYRAKWGPLAYRKAFVRHALRGVPVIIASVVHTAYLPGCRILSGGMRFLLVVPAAYLIVVGVALWARAIFTFGFDNLAMVYVYFPERGRLVDSSIYGIIRHPAYAAVIRIGMGLGLWRGTWVSIALGLFTQVGLTLWLRLVEERELLERLGESYAAYRRRVPAFWPHPRDWGRFLAFVMRGQATDINR